MNSVLGGLLFFYGTLMSRGSRGHYLSDLAEPIGPGAIRGDLFLVGGALFPALLEGAGTVHGEVWSVKPGCLTAALRLTDQIECYYSEAPQHSMYLREKRQLLRLPSGDPSESVFAGRTVWTYVWNHGHRGLTPIPDGRWNPGLGREAQRERLAAAHARPDW
jgi:gamma-glutamylcyclotransferase (GGCT)/AIG2-like uncharacterized protein YtfP